MTLQPLWKGSELLHKLLADYLAGFIETPLFCSNFEQAFNFDVDQGALTPIESDAFQRLFDEVVYFSPFAEERARFRTTGVRSRYAKQRALQRRNSRAAPNVRFHPDQPFTLRRADMS